MRVTIDLETQYPDRLRVIETMADWKAFKKEWKARLANVKVLFQWDVKSQDELPALLVMGPLHHYGTTQTTVQFAIIRNVEVLPAPEPNIADPDAAPALA